MPLHDALPTWRSASSPGLPPGSRVSTTSSPRARSASARRFSWVDFPTPSPPSRLMKRPRFTSADEMIEARHDAVEETGFIDGSGGDERHLLQFGYARGDDPVGGILAGLDMLLPPASEYTLDPYVSPT